MDTFNCFSFVFVVVYSVYGRGIFKLLKNDGAIAEDLSGHSYKCKTITFSEQNAVVCSAQCHDPRSVKWRNSQFYSQLNSDQDLTARGLYCKYFAFTSGQCSLCLRSNGFDPPAVQISEDDDYIGLKAGSF